MIEVAVQPIGWGVPLIRFPRRNSKCGKRLTSIEAVAAAAGKFANMHEQTYVDFRRTAGSTETAGNKWFRLRPRDRLQAVNPD